MTYHYSPEGANYHNEGKPPREPTRDLPVLSVSREQVKDAEIKRLNRIIEVMQEQSQHFIGEAQASADYWHGVACHNMERAYKWEQEYDKLFALLNPKCESCQSKGFTYITEYTTGGHPYNTMVPCPQGCGSLPASQYLTGEEQAKRTQKFIDDRLDLERKS